MKKLACAILVLSTLLSHTLVFAGTQTRQDTKKFPQPARSVSQFQSSYLRTIRLLQHRQQLEQLREEVSSEAKRGVHTSSPETDADRKKTNFPNDTYYYSSGLWGQSYEDLWGIKKIGLDSSIWKKYQGEGIKIAIIDTGIISTHEDIASNIWNNPLEIANNGLDDDSNGYADDTWGWDFVENDNSPTDLNGHGTHVAGIAAASGNNSKGIIGVAPLATIIPIRVLDRYGSGTVEAVAKGIEYAAKAGAQVINLSLGAADLDLESLDIFQKAIDFAKKLGSIIVAAAGNNDSNVDDFSPANMDGVIAVGAVGPYDNRATFSNHGSKLFITAPGVDILSLGSAEANIGSWWVPTTDYHVATGTSMAAPFVSGSVALLLNKYPGASLDFITSRLSAGAVDLGEVGWDPYFGHGLLNIANSLKLTKAAFLGDKNSSQELFSNDFLFRLVQRKRDEKIFFIPRKLDLGGGQSITVTQDLN